LLEQRAKLLQEGDSTPSTGTPALKGFWLQALKHNSDINEHVEEWDQPVLEFLKDIRHSYLDTEDPNKGFLLTFTFADNPYFENSSLWKEYHIEESSPYTNSINVTEIKASGINWKPGKDVTVERIQKKVKGGGAKKAKQKNKETEQPRSSFFRFFFRSLLKHEMELPDDIRLDIPDMDEEDEESMDEHKEEIIELLLETHYDIGETMKDSVIPFAVRWYTGEAAPDESDDDDDDDDEDDDDEDSDAN